MTAFQRLFIICLLTIVSYPAYSQGYQYKTTNESENIVKLKNLRNSLSVGLHYGSVQMFQSAISDNSSMLKISDYHEQWNLTFEYYLLENTAFQLATGLQYIPKEKKIDSLSWTPGAGLGGIRAGAHGKGGAVIPVTLGVKKTFFDGFTRPYLSGGLGFSYLIIGEGTASVIDGDKDKNISKQSQYTFYWKAGIGVQQRMGKVIRLDLGLDFFGSPRLSPIIGSLDHLSGWYLSIGCNIILKSKK